MLFCNNRYGGLLRHHRISLLVGGRDRNVGAGLEVDQIDFHQVAEVMPPLLAPKALE
jgi:hypothetical protein